MALFRRNKLDGEIAIKIEGVDKHFKLPHEKTNTIKTAIVNFWRRKRSFETQVALQGISVEIKKGEFFGIIGRNGSGKSTLLKLLAGIYTPTRGQIHLNGRLTPFIELGVGFNPELTGRENVYLNGALLGFSRKEMTAMYDDIVEFAELSRFMDQKLKNYSSGMQVRLAFSIAIRADAEILLIDEVLAVGDALFQKKCYEYFQSIKHSDKTVVFVSHDMNAVQNFCDRALLISNNKALFVGNAQDAAALYHQTLDTNRSDFGDNLARNLDSRGVSLTHAEVLNSKKEVSIKIEENEPFTLRLHYQAREELKNPVVGVAVMNIENQSIIGPNTKESGFEIKKLIGEGYVDASFADNPLAPGRYHLVAGIFDSSGKIPYDFSGNLMEFTITGTPRHANIYIPPKWSVK